MLVGKGSIIGEEDAISRQTYSCIAKCYSFTGTVYAIAKENFMTLKK